MTHAVSRDASWWMSASRDPVVVPSSSPARRGIAMPCVPKAVGERSGARRTTAGSANSRLEALTASPPAVHRLPPGTIRRSIRASCRRVRAFPITESVCRGLSATARPEIRPDPASGGERSRRAGVGRKCSPTVAVSGRPFRCQERMRRGSAGPTVGRTERQFEETMAADQAYPGLADRPPRESREPQRGDPVSFPCSSNPSAPSTPFTVDPASGRFRNWRPPSATARRGRGPHRRTRCVVDV
jgi:hypothetical protein